MASASLEERSKRRGVAGLLYAYKIAGAKAETAASLEEVTSIATKAATATRSIGVALTPCTVPAAGRPTFTLGDDEMEIGMGIDGERGVRRGKLLTADAIAEEMLSLLLADMPLQTGDRVSVSREQPGRYTSRRAFHRLSVRCSSARGDASGNRVATGRAVCDVNGDGWHVSNLL